MSIFEQAFRSPVPFFPKDPLHEGFRTYRTSEQQIELASKVARVLARRAGMTAYPGQAPYFYKRNGDEYVSFFSMTDTDLAFRITFSLEGDTQRIICIDVYKSPKPLDNPDFTISILDPNINIVQLVNEVGDKMLQGDISPEDFEATEGMMAESVYWVREKEKLKESAKKDAVIEFLKTQGGTYTDYIRWATANNKPMGSQTMFSNAKKVFDATGGQSPGTAAAGQPYTVTPAEDEEPLYAEEDADAFEDVVEDEAVQKFEEFEIMLREMAHDAPATWALFVYGSPGIGKTYSIKKVFKEEDQALKRTNQKVVTKTGAVAGSTGLLQLLYDNKKSVILVLDDNDKILRDQSAANYLKGALNTEIEDRHITYTRANLSALFAEEDEEEPPEIEDENGFEDDEFDMEESHKNYAHIFENDEGNTIFKTASKKVNLGKLNLQEAKPDEDGETIRDFYFRSRIIFVSNMLEVPPAVDDRCYSIDMVFDYDQITELIEKAMDNIDIPNVSHELKEEVIQFLRRNRWAIERKLGRQVVLTFRKFRNACVAWETATRHGLPKKRAKQWAMRQLRGAN